MERENYFALAIFHQCTSAAEATCTRKGVGSTVCIEGDTRCGQQLIDHHISHGRGIVKHHLIAGNEGYGCFMQCEILVFKIPLTSLLSCPHHIGGRCSGGIDTQQQAVGLSHKVVVISQQASHLYLGHIHVQLTATGGQHIIALGKLLGIDCKEVLPFHRETALHHESATFSLCCRQFHIHIAWQRE